MTRPSLSGLLRGGAALSLVLGIGMAGSVKAQTEPPILPPADRDAAGEEAGAAPAADAAAEEPDAANGEVADEATDDAAADAVEGEAPDAAQTDDEALRREEPPRQMRPQTRTPPARRGPTMPARWPMNRPATRSRRSRPTISAWRPGRARTHRRWTPRQLTRRPTQRPLGHRRSTRRRSTGRRSTRRTPTWTGPWSRRQQMTGTKRRTNRLLPPGQRPIWTSPRPRTRAARKTSLQPWKRVSRTDPRLRSWRTRTRPPQKPRRTKALS
jgi:hypothetical protein